MADKVKVLVSKKNNFVVLDFNEFTRLISELGSYGIKGGFVNEVFNTLFTNVQSVDMDSPEFKAKFQEEIDKIVKTQKTNQTTETTKAETQADGFAEQLTSTEQAQATSVGAAGSAFEGYNPKGPSKF